MESQVWDADMGWLADDIAARLATASDDLTVLVAEGDDNAQELIREAGPGQAHGSE
jgi:hypothetical protein